MEQTKFAALYQTQATLIPHFKSEKVVNINQAPFNK